MTGILLLLFSLCPAVDTGKFYFTEFLQTNGQADTFYGKIYVYPEKNIRMEVESPDKQLYLFRSDSIYMIFDVDTQIVYKKGLGKLIFGEADDTSFVKKEFNGGCMVVSTDSAIYDTLFVYGKKVIDSLRFTGENTTVRIHLRRGQ